jgi:2-iminobutanoate/2-iminopropanoate deaminase
MKQCCSKEIITCDKVPPAIGPYSVGVKIGHLAFISGQLGFDPETAVLVEGGVEAETHQALKNLRAILESAGSSLDNVVKTTVFLMDMGDFAKVNAIYAEYFTQNPPARSAVQVSALPKGGLVEIEAIVHMPQEHKEGHCC